MTDLALGWIAIIISFAVYALTMEPTTSFWDCGEFIASAYKLQVGHPPGAPLFAMIARLFALLAGGDVTKVAMMVNLVSVTSSAFTIGFLYWSIVAVLKKIRTVTTPKNADGSPLTWTKDNAIMTLGAAFVGAMAYTFTDTFWFSAVEGEVYAMSSWFTAIVFWAILRWDEAADEPHADRWLILIMYLMGLSIGVHLLNLLTIPAMGLVYYFRKYKANPMGTIITLIISGFIFLFITYIVIPGTVSLAGFSERIFTNNFGSGFGTGFMVYLVILTGVVIGAIYMTRKSNLRYGYLGSLSLFVILLGYSSYGMIAIRSQANTPMDENNPENVYSMIAYLNREQYGSRPLFYGPFYDARIKEYAKGDPNYIPVYQVVNKSNNKKPIASFQIEREAKEFIEKSKDKGSLEIKTGYVISDYKVEPVYESSRKTFIPRMWSSEGHHRPYYESYGGVKKGGKPTFGNNLAFMFSYQYGWMYFRYFMWNFAGRESDIQGQGEPLHGNWISGIGLFDEFRLGYPQSDLPKEVADNKGRNKYYFLPLILGAIGLYWSARKSKKVFLSILVLFIFTGIMIVFHNNASPVQPRERDYVFAGSFYVYCMWIGLGVYGLYDMLKHKSAKIGYAILPVSFLAVPVLLASQNWDDHTRANRYTARDFAYNYLMSCEKDAILFTNGDNDTFPLWYLQEVEGVRTDVRIVNLSLLNTDWYITQMKRAAYDGKPVPFSMTEPEYRQGTRDQVLLDTDNKEFYTPKAHIDFLKKTDGTNEYAMQGGDKLFYLKSNKFFIPVDSADVVNKGLVRKGEEFRVSKKINGNGLPWTVNKNYLLKADVMIVDLLSNINWDRPIYFAITVGEGSYLGLQQFFEVEGLTYRLKPYKARSHDGQTGEINTDVMYKNMVEEFKWGNMNGEGVYLDETNMRMTMNLRNNFYRLATALAAKNQTDKALKCLDKTEELMPDNIVPYNYFNYLIADLYLKLGKKEKAKEIITKLKERMEVDVAFYSKVSNRNKASIKDDQERSTAILGMCNEFLKGINDPNKTSELEKPDNSKVDIDTTKERDSTNPSK